MGVRGGFERNKRLSLIMITTCIVQIWGAFNQGDDATAKKYVGGYGPWEGLH